MIKVGESEEVIWNEEMGGMEWGQGLGGMKA